MRRKLSMPIPLLAVGFEKLQVTLNKEPRRPAAGIIDLHPRLGVENLGHEDGHLPRGVELARTLTLPLSELPQKVLVRPSQNVRLYILQPQPIAAQDLHQCRKPCLINYR